MIFDNSFQQNESKRSRPVTSLGAEGRPEYVIQIFRSVLAGKVPATLACARLSDSIVGTYLQRAKRK